jgi:hypothetical protein
MKWKRLLLFIGGCILTLALAASVTQAAPPLLKHPTAEETLVLRVHDCNRLCRLGPVPRWGGVVRWHRHVGYRCLPVRC